LKLVMAPLASGPLSFGALLPAQVLSPTVGEQARAYLVAALLLVAIQAALIILLLVQRQRRQRVEADLREAHQVMDLTATAGGIGFWTRDPATREVEASAHLRRLFGFGEREVVRVDDMLARIHPDDRERVSAVVGRAERDGSSFEGEFRITRAGGEERWVVGRGGVVRQPRGGGVRRMGVLVDITERRRSETDLRESEARFRAMAETTTDVIVIMSEESTILFINAATEKVFGYRPGELLGQKLTVLMPEAVRRHHLEGLRRYLGTGERRVAWGGASFPGLHRDGRVIDLEVAMAECRVDDRRVFAGIVRDVSERRRSELALIQQRAELARMARVSTMGELAASLAHELSQPLTAILSNARAGQRLLASEAVDPALVREILADIVQDDQRAAEILRSMRALIRKEAREPEAIDVAGVVGEVVSLVHSDAILRDVRVAMEFLPDLPPVRGDRVQLQQVVLNLLVNAFEAMRDSPAGGRNVLVRGDLDPAGLVRVAVRDYGVGVAADRADRIFEPFFTTKHDGLGMGLAICRSIIEAHRGRLWLENNTEGGVTFYFTVPSVSR
jgi:two-component system sensor kinase FixL